MQKRTKDEKGLGLIEAVTAIAIFVIVATASFPILLNSVKTLQLNKLTTSATATVNTIVEKVRNDPTCVNILSVLGENYISESRTSSDVDIVLSNSSFECDPGKVYFAEIVATRASDDKELFRHSIQIFVLPSDGMITDVSGASFTPESDGSFGNAASSLGEA